MSSKNVYSIVKCSVRNETLSTGTIDELLNKFSYTLLCGKSWQHEKGRHKINTQPKTIKGLITNLNNAVSNSSANGCSKYYYKEGSIL